MKNDFSQIGSILTREEAKKITGGDVAGIGGWHQRDTCLCDADCPQIPEFGRGFCMQSRDPYDKPNTLRCWVWFGFVGPDFLPPGV